MLGLVHQDVKPANVMMTVEIVKGSVRAQVTDFGLTHAKLAGGRQYVPEPVKDILLSCGGYSPAYCSPEQEKRQKVTFKTDIWSWAVSVLEMFTGKIFWSSGSVAGAALEEFLENGGCSEGIPPMPKELADILMECLIKNPGQRLESLGIAVERLKKVYRNEIGMEYGRTLTEPLLKDNNKTYFDERRTRDGIAWTEPVVWLKRALKAEGRDPEAAEKIMAQHGASRRGQMVGELTGYDAACRIYERLINGGRKDLEVEFAQLCMEKASVHKTANDSSGELAEYDRVIEIHDRLVNMEGRHELVGDLASAKTQRGLLMIAMGNSELGKQEVHDAVAVLREEIKRTGRADLKKALEDVTEKLGEQV